VDAAASNAVLEQRGDVMDAVQRMRQQAYDTATCAIRNSLNTSGAGPRAGNIEILPAYSGYYYVPYYKPVVVYSGLVPVLWAEESSGCPRIAIGASFARSDGVEWALDGASITS